MQTFKFIIKNGLFYLTAGLVLAALASMLKATAVQAQTIEIEVPTAPTISIIHNNQILEATTDDAGVDHNSWQYAVFNREPNCEDPNINYVPAHINNRRQVVTSANNGQWFCFKVTNADDLTGFAKYRVSGVIDPVATPVSQPEEEEMTEMGPDPAADFEISVEQDGQTLTAEIVSGFKNPQWEVTLIDADADCSAENEEAFANSRRVHPSHQVNGLSWRDSGRHYCFRAMEDAQGETMTAYRGIKVSGLERPASAQTGQTTAPAPATPATTQTPVSETPQSTAPTTSAGEGSTDQEENGGDEDNEGLRQIGVGIVLLGVLAVIIVMVVSRKQDREAELEEEEEEPKPKKKKK